MAICQRCTLKDVNALPHEMHSSSWIFASHRRPSEVEACGQLNASQAFHRRRLSCSGDADTKHERRAPQVASISIPRKFRTATRRPASHTSIFLEKLRSLQRDLLSSTRAGMSFLKVGVRHSPALHLVPLPFSMRTAHIITRLIIGGGSREHPF